MASVLVSPLNWGLGHATRDIPVIQNLLSHGHEVTLAASGNARKVLSLEFPDCRSIEFPDYPAPYSKSRFFLPKFAASIPALLGAVSAEREGIQKILRRDKYDLIISDNRLGVFSGSTPSVFISHQLHYHLPLIAWPFELAAVWLNGFLHSKFDRVIVPDNPPGPLSLAGKLSRADSRPTRERVYYSGILTSMRKRQADGDLDYLFIISGPEPQRTELEHILLPQVERLEGSRTVLLGSPDRTDTPESRTGVTIMNYASTQEKEYLMNRAGCIICRSGYTSMMELAELNKASALLIPTPGQTEQEYLAAYYQAAGWFPSVSQYSISLDQDLRPGKAYAGFPPMTGTEENVKRLYRDVLAGYLE